MKTLDILMAQINTLVGDFEGNTDRVIEVIQRAEREREVPVVVFPELTLSGYPPEDLLLRPSLDGRVQRSLDRICSRMTGRAYAVIGYPRRFAGRLFNVAAVLHGGAVVAEYRKQSLPNYQVFDEKRYFSAGQDPCVVDIAGVPVGLSVCEDLWEDGPTLKTAAAGARLLLNINASPYHRGKRGERWHLAAERARRAGLPIVYVNQVGAQDELVFDGGSFAVTADGTVAAAAPNFVEGEYWLTLDVAARDESGAAVIGGTPVCPPLDELEATWHALVLGVRDYVEKNSFRGVVLGLSGGIDSALTLAVAVAALGPARVEAVMMPFRYTSQMSIEDAAQQSRLLGVRHVVISIEAIYTAFMAGLREEFAATRPDSTEENLQARCRGVLLMAISNKKGLLVLTTGNKSEMAVGYSTLYGDMAGGFEGCVQNPGLRAVPLPQHAGSVHTPACNRSAPVRRAGPRPERRGQPAALRDTGPHYRAVCRAGLQCPGDHRDGHGSRAGIAGAAPGGSQRVQAPAGAHWSAHHAARLRARSPLPHHLGLDHR